MVNFFEEYTLTAECKIVYWKLPVIGTFKCNSYRETKGKPGPSYSVFCIRNEHGDFMYAETRRVGDGPILVAETMALRMGLKYCISHNLLLMVLKTDSCTVKMVLDGLSEVPWCIAM